MANAQARDAVLTREGSDGNEQWHATGPLSAPAGGRAQRLIESQTERSLEALFNYQKHGSNLADITAKIRGQGAGNAGNGKAPEEETAIPAITITPMSPPASRRPRTGM